MKSTTLSGFTILSLIAGVLAFRFFAGHTPSALPKATKPEAIALPLAPNDEGEKSKAPSDLRRPSVKPRSMAAFTESVELFQNKMDDFFAIQPRIDKQQREQELIHELLSNPIIKDIMIKTLVEPAFAIKQFADHQAHARIFAIKLLEENAIAGNFAELESVIQTLHNQRLENPLEFQNRKQDHDLRDLLTGWINAYGKERFIENPSTLTKNLFPGQTFSHDEKLLILKAAHNIVAPSFENTVFRKNFYAILKGKNDE